MKHVTKTFAMLFLGGTVVLTACKKDAKTSPDAISQETLTRISNLGFSTANVQKTAQGYLVEGDINLTEEELNAQPTSPLLRIANEEQYHTFNLVTALPRKINVTLSSNAPQYFVDATKEAVGRYNAQNLTLSFQYNSSTGTTATINIVTFYEQSNVLGSSGFPSSSGNPYPTVNMNTYWYDANTDVHYLATIIAHEMGHCIGFRHTDYMSRRFSCGYGGNEGQAKNGVGAVLIPGTPSGPDAASWMLACIGDGVNRPFNPNDVIALNYLY
jgi:hypothetical protein